MTSINILTTPWWSINDSHSQKLHQEISDTSANMSETASSQKPPEKKNIHKSNTSPDELDDDNNLNFSLDNETILKKIDEISKNTSFKKEKDIHILQNQNLIATYLSKYVVQNTEIEYDFFYNLVKWLEQASDYLSDKIKLEKTFHNLSSIKYTDRIPRCSYKFCDFLDGCNFNYGVNSKNGCYADHYVHNKIGADMKALLYYLEWNKDKIMKGEMVHNKEIITCVNTIRHVIDHMFKELHNIYYYHDKKDEYQLMHRNKAVHRNKKRKNNNRNNNSKDKNNISKDKKNNNSRNKNRSNYNNKGKSNKDFKSNKDSKK